MEVLALRNLSFTYPGAARPALDNVSLSVRRGEFVVLCGTSGCGKTTLLRQLKTVLTPHGERTGEVLFGGEPLELANLRRQSSEIGFVQQSPENQLVADKVWHELAFGLESLGTDTPSIRRRVAEMAAFFGIQTWFRRDVSELSGGQKQLLNLASVMVMQPSVLVLDEPTAQLDPIAASDFLSMLGRINRELGTTVILSEHRLEDALPLAGRVIVLDGGRILCDDSPARVGIRLREAGHGMYGAMPAAVRVWNALGGTGDCPVTVREGRDFLEKYAETHPVGELPPVRETPPVSAEDADCVLAAEDVSFAYGKELPDVVRGLTLAVRRGELLALLGGNGVGKSTALRLLAGVYRPYRGEITRCARVTLLPQSPQTLFSQKTVREELAETARMSSEACSSEADGTDPKSRRGRNARRDAPEPVSGEEVAARVGRMVRLCRLEELLDRHPYDLSGGEQQRTALAKLLLTDPQVLLLDEPTKGLDADFKRRLAEILRHLLDEGRTVVMVSHDLEFCASYADRCALFFDGSVAAEGSPREFFSGNSFYTTSSNRMARGLLPLAVTPGDIAAGFGAAAEDDAAFICGDASADAGETLPSADCALPNTPVDAENAPCGETASSEGENTASDGGKASSREGRARTGLPPRLSLGRSIAVVLSGMAAIASVLIAAGLVDLGDIPALKTLFTDRVWVYGLLIGSLTVLAVSLGHKRSHAFADARAAEPAPSRGRVGKRAVAASVLLLLAVPLTLAAGLLLPGSGSYYPIAVLVLLECMLPFFLRFEGRRPQARELCVIAVLCAVGVAGRAAFFMLPQFKPVMAITIIAGVALGGESGFLVGAVTMLVSNVLFSQGPWTPWQMFAMGIIGFLAGVLFRRGRLRPTVGALCVYGALAAVLIYGGLMNPVSALLTYGGDALNMETLTAFWAAGFPLDCVHAAATALFLYFGAEPMLERLERVRKKYGFC